MGAQTTPDTCFYVGAPLCASFAVCCTVRLLLEVAFLVALSLSWQSLPSLFSSLLFFSRVVTVPRCLAPLSLVWLNRLFLFRSLCALSHGVCCCFSHGVVHLSAHDRSFMAPSSFCSAALSPPQPRSKMTTSFLNYSRRTRLGESPLGAAVERGVSAVPSAGGQGLAARHRTCVRQHTHTQERTSENPK